MKLSGISRLHTNLLSEEEGLKEIDNGAGTELDGTQKDDSELDNLFANSDLKSKQNSDSELDNLLGDKPETKQEPEAKPEEEYNPKVNSVNTPKNSSGYTIKNVTDQLDGIVNNWFEFAVDMPPDAKEKFLALGERVSEISDILKKEYSNA